MAIFPPFFCCNFVLFIYQFLTSEAGEVASIFNELQSTLSTQQGEMAVFAKELRQVCPLIFTLSCCKLFTSSIPHDCSLLTFVLLKGFATLKYFPALSFHCLTQNLKKMEA
jgi:hypothetical protein